jgi:hypothetical protein
MVRLCDVFFVFGRRTDYSEDVPEERHLPSFLQQHNTNATITTAESAKTVKIDHGIVDSGFSITEPLYRFLKEHRHSYNDTLAFINSVVLLIPGVWGAWTVWVGMYAFIFRILFTQLLRSFCGWATYLPPSNEYLMSYYDFPDVAQCLLGAADCTADYPDVNSADGGGDDAGDVLPFVSFFSGHVGTYNWLTNT